MGTGSYGVLDAAHEIVVAVEQDGGRRAVVARALRCALQQQHGRGGFAGLAQEMELLGSMYDTAIAYPAVVGCLRPHVDRDVRLVALGIAEKAEAAAVAAATIRPEAVRWAKDAQVATALARKGQGDRLVFDHAARACRAASEVEGMSTRSADK